MRARDASLQWFFRGLVHVYWSPEGAWVTMSFEYSLALKIPLPSFYFRVETVGGVSVYCLPSAQVWPKGSIFSPCMWFSCLSLFFNENTGARLTTGPQELSIRGMKYSESLIFLGDLQRPLMGSECSSWTCKEWVRGERKINIDEKNGERDILR